MRRARRDHPVLVAGLCAVGMLAAVGHAASVRFGAASAADTVSFQELEESLTCQCGCGLTVHACNHLQCPSAIPLRDEIRAQMQPGKGREEILAYFSAKYGEKILSAPTAVGFNLLAWITPFVVLGVGGVILGIVLTRWSARGGTPTDNPAAPSGPVSQYEKILEKELKNFDG